MSCHPLADVKTHNSCTKVRTSLDPYPVCENLKYFFFWKSSHLKCKMMMNGAMFIAGNLLKLRSICKLETVVTSCSLKQNINIYHLLKWDKVG